MLYEYGLILSSYCSIELSFNNITFVLNTSIIKGSCNFFTVCYYLFLLFTISIFLGQSTWIGKGPFVEDLDQDFAFIFGMGSRFLSQFRRRFLFDFLIDVDADKVLNRLSYCCLDLFSQPCTFLDLTRTLISSISNFPII